MRPGPSFAELPDIVLIVDARTLAVAAVNRDAAVFGHSPSLLLGRSLGELLPDLPATALRALALASEPDGETLVTRLRRADGSRVAVDVRFGRLVEGVVPVVLREDRVADELRDTNLFLDAIVENIPDMIFVKDAETLLFKRFNRAGEELLGWTRDQLLGKTDHDFYPKEQADFFHAKDRETLRRGVLVDVPEEPIETKARGLRWLHTKKVPVAGGDGRPRYLLGISEDITARKEAEARAQSLERELAQLASSARDAMAAWTPDGKVVSWNPAAESLLGIPSRDAIGHDIRTILPDGLSSQYESGQRQLAAGAEVPLYSISLRRRDGRELDLEVSLFTIRDADGKRVRNGAIARDVTELRRLKRAAEIMSARDRTSLPVDKKSRSRAMQEVLAGIDIVAADRDATVLLLGETGVGKGWLARQIHGKSPRAEAPFFEVNCAGLGPQLVESELFGHERGAFTGAATQKRGIVEVAEGGTLFLDEIGELPPGVQAQLLTFLDQRTFRRVGGTRVLRADVRLLAATNVDLQAAVGKGTFRRDLYYRLSVVPVTVPPLRERREEIPALAIAILVELAQRGRRHDLPPDQMIDRSAVAALGHYGWPGNVRELRNAIERALILSRGARIGLEHLPPELRGETGATAAGTTSTRLDDAERAHILRVLDEAGGNRTRAAELLGISRSTLKRKLAELRLSAGSDEE